MIEYRNMRTGRVLTRPAEDKWLEASKGWARVDESPEPPAEPKNEGSN